MSDGLNEMFKKKYTPIEKLMLDRLKKTCGGDCISDPYTCSCFGPMTSEAYKDLGLNWSDISPDEAFYKKEHCSHYDREQFYLREELKRKGVIFPSWTK